MQLVLTQVVLGWLGNSICHLHISHNALHLPPKILYKRCLQFLLEQLYYPGEMKNKGDAKFGGQIRHIMGDMQAAYICSVMLQHFE